MKNIEDYLKVGQKVETKGSRNDERWKVGAVYKGSLKAKGSEGAYKSGFREETGQVHEDSGEKISAYKEDSTRKEVSEKDHNGRAKVR